MYDITDDDSFRNISYWLANIKLHATDNIEKILVGNKTDKLHERRIATGSGAELGNQYGMKFFEISCKDGTNVDKTLITLTSNLLLKVNEVKPASPPCDLSSKKGRKKMSICTLL
jgi:GTPase SAR1 family protein